MKIIDDLKAKIKEFLLGINKDNFPKKYNGLAHVILS